MSGAGCTGCGGDLASVSGRRTVCDGCRAERARERAKAWYAANQVRAMGAANARYHAQKGTEAGERVRAANLQRKKARAAERYARNQEWVKANPDRMAAYRKAYAHKRRLQAPSKVTGPAILAIFAAQGGRCAYCRVSLKGRGREAFHIDHIQPLARGGLHVTANLQACCGGCNRRKAAKDPIEFARSLGLLV